MNKSLLLSMPIMAILFSCSSNEENLSEQNSDKEIKFITNVPAMSVRSVEDISSSNITTKGFKVSAYKSSAIWAGIDESAPSNSSSSWSFSPAKYMPATGSLNFWAYSPTDLTVSGKSENGFTLEYEPSTTVANQKDIVAAYTSTSNSPISLTFKHLLSKIKFNVKSGATNGYTISIKGVRLGWIKRGKGTLTYNAGTATWANATGNATASYEIGGSSETPIDVTSTATDINSFTDNAFYVLPQKLTAWDASEHTTENAYISFLCQIKQYGNKEFPSTPEDYAWGAAIGIDTNWQPGYEYTYNITFFPNNGGCGYPDPKDPPTPFGPIVPGGGGSSSEIKFSVSVDTWTSQTENPSYSN